MEEQSPDGNSQLGVQEVRARTIRGTTLSHKEIGEISAEMDAVETIVKQKASTWNKSSEESVKRETELFKMVGAPVMDEEREDRKRNDQRLAWRGSKEKRRGGRSQKPDRRDAAATSTKPRIEAA